jgi:Asp-tRNA(Asn)/Glu-tRNA(Gln) amidotransferase A subunit family amidase
MPGVVGTILATYAVTIAGIPALSVPNGVSSEGLPIGLQIIGGWRADGGVLGAGIAFEEVS